MNMSDKTKTIKGDEVQQNPDPHIDQDFPGFPHLPADKKSITPVTTDEKKLAGVKKKKSKKVYGSWSYSGMLQLKKPGNNDTAYWHNNFFIDTRLRYTEPGFIFKRV